MSTENIKIVISAQDKTKTAFKSTSNDLKKLETQTKTFKGKISGLGSTFSKMAIVGGIAFTALGIGISKATQAAVDAQEIFNKFDVVFGDVKSEAGKVSDSFVENFGLARSSAQDLLSSTGDMLTGFGFTGGAALKLSKKVNELAVDLASFTNLQGGAERASKALTKGLLGERESMKELGIAILDEDVNIRLAQKGLEDLTGMALRQAKAQATLEIAMEQSKNAIGDFARTASSSANLQRKLGERTKELSEAFGLLFESSLQKVLQALVPLVEKITTLIEENPKLTKTLGLLAIAFAGLALAVGLVGIALIALSTAAGPAIVAFLAFAGPIAVVVAGLSILASIISEKLNFSYEEATKKSLALAEKSGDLASKLRELRTPIEMDAEEMKSLAEKTRKAGIEVQEIQDKINDVVEDFNNRKKDINRQTAEAIVAQEKNVASIQKELEEEKAKDSESQNADRIKDLQNTLLIEREALVSKAELEKQLADEVSEARRRAGITAFERKMEDLQREKKAEQLRFNEKIALLREELVEANLVLEGRKKAEQDLTAEIKKQNEMRREEYIKTKEEAIRTTDTIIVQNERLQQQSGGFGKLIKNVGNVLGFAEGGVVPGPIGTPVPAIVHGGETVIPSGRSIGNNITINNPVLLDDTMLSKLSSELGRMLRNDLRV